MSRTVHRVAKGRTRLKRLSTHAYIPYAETLLWYTALESLKGLGNSPVVLSLRLGPSTAEGTGLMLGLGIKIPEAALWGQIKGPSQLLCLTRLCPTL